MTITLIHPSRSRPKQAAITAKNWLDRADTKPEYILSLDIDDPMLGNYRDHKYLFSTILIKENRSAIQAINRAAKEAKGDIFVVVSDDFDCPHHWDTLLLEALEGKEDYCAKVDDGHQKWIITLPIMDRKYYDRTGYIYHPDCLHIFADTIMTSVAWMLDRYVPIDITFIHMHNNAGYGGKDAINIRNDRTWGHGELLFKKLRRINFELPLDSIVNKELPDVSGLNTPRYR